MIPADDIIEGSYRVIATRDPSSRPSRKSPNRKRAAARIVLWNLALIVAAIGVPSALR